MKAILKNKNLDTEGSSIIRKIIKYRDNLQKILNKYNVEDIEEINKKIEKHQITEHPSYEDYLEGLGYKLEIENLLKEFEARVKVVRELVKWKKD